MTGRRDALDWSFRLVIAVLALLWLAYPPQQGASPAPATQRTVTR